MVSAPVPVVEEYSFAHETVTILGTSKLRQIKTEKQIILTN